LSEAEAALPAKTDLRSREQQAHDVFASLIDTIARSGDTPTIGGTPPTVLVTVRADDLESGHGQGHIDGLDTPIPMQSVRQFVCTGGTQHVILNQDGKIIQLGSEQRCFTPQQRRAIMARDGGCIIPGCSIPAGWTEIHHVAPAAEDGPTHTDNGVCLCWWHHHMLEISGWQIRMHHGKPQVRAPGWLDPYGEWRDASKAPTSMKDQLTKRLG